MTIKENGSSLLIISVALLLMKMSGTVYLQEHILNFSLSLPSNKSMKKSSLFASWALFTHLWAIPAGMCECVGDVMIAAV